MKSSHQFFLLFVLTATTSSVLAADYSVGDSSQWNNQVDYTAWGADKTFNVGDNLVFNFASNLHQVDEVDQADCDACTSSNALNVHKNPPVTINLKTPGSMCFICPILNHCSSGMKLQIRVENSTTTGNSTSPPAVTPNRASPPPPPFSGALAVAVPLWFMGFLSLVVVILV